MCSRSPSPPGPRPRCGRAWPIWRCRRCRPARSTPPRCASCGTSPSGCCTAGRCPRWWRARPGWSRWPPPAPACAPTAPAPATWPARSSGPSRAWSSRTTTRSRRPRPAGSRRTTRPRWPKVYAAYEQVKRTSGVIDFEDLLRAAVWGIEEHPDVAEQIRSQYRHFVVDEYQDVNPAQQRLLQAWLGDRDDLTVVGDASQTIYSFTGATSSYLTDFARRLPRRGERHAGPPGPRLPLDPAGRRAGQPGHPAGPGQRGPAAAGAGRPAPARARTR